MDEMVEPGQEGLLGDEASLPVAVGAESVSTALEPAEEPAQLHLQLLEPEPTAAHQPIAEGPVEEASAEALQDPALQAVLASLEDAPVSPALEVVAEQQPAATDTGVPAPVTAPLEAGSPPASAPVLEPLRIPRGPFALYGAVWAAFVAAVYLRFGSSGGTGSLLGSVEYRVMVYVGMGMAILGPVLAVVVLIASLRRTAGSERFELLARVFMITAAITLFGVAAWWGALFAVDAMRTGLSS